MHEIVKYKRIAENQFPEEHQPEEQQKAKADPKIIKNTFIIILGFNFYRM